jgi:hypothetical protein
VSTTSIAMERRAKLEAKGWVDPYEAGIALERGYIRTSFEHQLILESLPTLDTLPMFLDSQLTKSDYAFELEAEYEEALLAIDMPEEP